MNKQYMIKGLDKYLNFIKLIMNKDINVCIYSNIDDKKILRSHDVHLAGMLKPTIKAKFSGLMRFDERCDCNVELNHYESNDNKVEFDSSEIFTKKIARFNFYCSNELLRNINIYVIQPFGRQFKQSIEEWKKTHEDESGYMLQPPEKSDPNYKELMKRYWYECNQRN